MKNQYHQKAKLQKLGKCIVLIKCNPQAKISQACQSSYTCHGFLILVRTQSTLKQSFPTSFMTHAAHLESGNICAASEVKG